MGAIRILAIPVMIVIIVVAILLYIKWDTKWHDRKIDTKTINEKNKVYEATVNTIRRHALEHASFQDPLATIILDELTRMEAKLQRKEINR